MLKITFNKKQLLKAKWRKKKKKKSNGGKKKKKAKWVQNLERQLAVLASPTRR